MLEKTDIFAHEMYAPAKGIAKLLLEHDRILLCCHKSPDADAVGSMYALAYGLKQKGKTIAMCNVSGIPDYMDWLPKPSLVHKSLHGIGFKPDLAVVLDCGDAHRIGEIKDEILAYPSICIDHHIDNPQFGSVDNWVDTQMSATGQMVAAILNELDIPLSGDIAEALYAAISSDTGSFRYDSTSSKSLLLASYLVEQGLDIASVRSRMDNTWTLGRVRLWGDLMASVRIERGGSIALATVSLEQLSRHNARIDDLEGLVELLRQLRGVLAVAMLREDNPKQCKVSLRSTGEINVQAMVAPLGGGGHRNAAGAMLKGDLATNGKVILEAMNKWLDENGK